MGSDRSYEEAAEEFERLNFFQSIRRFADSFSGLSLGELMALRSRFIQLAYLEHDVEDDEQTSASHIAEALEEVIIFNLKADDEGLESYFRARNAEFDSVQEYGVGSIAFDLMKIKK